MGNPFIDYNYMKSLILCLENEVDSEYFTNIENMKNKFCEPENMTKEEFRRLVIYQDCINIECSNIKYGGRNSENQITAPYLKTNFKEVGICSSNIISTENIKIGKENSFVVSKKCFIGIVAALLKYDYAMSNMEKIVNNLDIDETFFYHKLIGYVSLDINQIRRMKSSINILHDKYPEEIKEFKINNKIM